MLVSSLWLSPVQPTSTDKSSAGQAWTVVSFETFKKTGSKKKLPKCYHFGNIFAPPSLAKVVISIFLYATICISKLLNSDHFRKMGEIFPKLAFRNSPDLIWAAFSQFLMSTCLQRLLAVKAGTSWVGHLSPSARSLKLLYYCVFDAFFLIYILSSQK